MDSRTNAYNRMEKEEPAAWTSEYVLKNKGNPLRNIICGSQNCDSLTDLPEGTAAHNRDLLHSFSSLQLAEFFADRDT
jgi:hypothetical protein